MTVLLGEGFLVASARRDLIAIESGSDSVVKDVVTVDVAPMPGIDEQVDQTRVPVFATTVVNQETPSTGYPASVLVFPRGRQDWTSVGIVSAS